MAFTLNFRQFSGGNMNNVLAPKEAVVETGFGMGMTDSLSGDILLALDKKEQSKQNMAIIIKNLILLIIGIVVLFLVSLFVIYNSKITTNEINSQLSSEIRARIDAEDQLKFEQQKTKLKDAVIYWNEEYNKPLSSLVLNDFSANPIVETPKEFVKKIVSASKEYGVPASIISAQIWMESRYVSNIVSFDGQRQEVLEFTNGVAYFGEKQGKILALKQVWNSKRNAFDVYVKYTSRYDWNPKSNWHQYFKECSVGLAQKNLCAGAQDKTTIKDALDKNKSADFVGDRWRGFLETYKKDSMLFVAMAYNTPGSAKNAKKYLENGSVGLGTLKDVRSAEYIIEYGKNVLSIARNQRLIEIYNEKFSEFNGNKDFDGDVPSIKLLPIK